MRYDTGRATRSWRQLLVALVVASGGAMLGVSAAPHQAQATESTEMAGWACNASDRCGSGSAKCCDDPTTIEDLTHCTTVESGACAPSAP
jgi:hypothetical protein